MSTRSVLASMDWTQMAPLLMLQLQEAVVMNSIYVMAAFMVLDFGLSHRDGVGNYAGFLVGAYFLGQACGSYAWGWAADRFGRKRCLVLGTVATLLTSLAFGLSPSYGFAVVMRFLAGISNGGMGIVKSLCGIISTRENQGMAFGLIGLIWGFGNIVGSTVGGLFSRPALKYAPFDAALWRAFPYLLPSLFAVLVSAVTLVMTLVMLREPKVLPPTSGKRQSIFNRSSLIAVTGYTLLGGVTSLSYECLPLFATATLSGGGLRWSTNDIGLLNAAGGLITILFFLMLYQPIFNLVGGHINAHRVGLACMVWISLLYPFISPLAIAGNDAAVWASMMALFLLQSCSTEIAYAPIMAMISNSVKRESMGALNGLSQTCVAISRCIMPAILGVVFSWSLTGDRSFPFDIQFVFALSALLYVALLLYSLLLPESLTEPFEESESLLEESEQSTSSHPQDLVECLDELEIP